MEEKTQDAVVNAPEVTFGIPKMRDGDDKLWLAEQIPTREEIERVERAAALDDDIPDAPRTVNDDDAIDDDPYGWIARVSAPDVFDDRPGSAQPEPEPEHVLVWQHAMIEPHRFDRAVAKVQPNGTLLVTRPGSDIPLKGYAPGVWITFEHIGEKYHTRAVQADTPRPRLVQDKVGSLHLLDDEALLERDRARAASRPGRVQMTNYLEQARNAPSTDEMVRLLTDPTRRTPPTHESDADDTETIPVVKTEKVEAGGGAGAPKARGAREGAEPIARTPRPGTGDPGIPEDEKTPGRLKSFWIALRNPDWEED